MKTIKRYKLMLFISTLALILLTQSNMLFFGKTKTYNIWSYIHVNSAGIDGNGQHFYRESDELRYSCEVIKSLPTEVKSVIALYSTRIYLTLAYNRKDLAHCLGDYSDLAEAQKDLMQNLQITSEQFQYGVNAELYIKVKGNKIIAAYKIPRFVKGETSAQADEFEIVNKNKIVFVKHYNNVTIDSD